MVLKTNRGIFEVTGVDIICEKRVPFNERIIRLVEYANNIADASALKFNLRTGSSTFGLPYAESSTFIGNLSNTVLQETVDSLTKIGYADITNWKFQRGQIDPDKYIFDDGASDPYICEECLGAFSPFAPMHDNGAFGAFNPSISEDVSDDFDFCEESEE